MRERESERDRARELKKDRERARAREKCAREKQRESKSERERDRTYGVRGEEVLQEGHGKGYESAYAVAHHVIDEKTALMRRQDRDKARDPPFQH